MLFSSFFKNFKFFGLEYFQRYYGSYRAFVEDNEDPEFKGRLKLRIPQIYEDEIPDYWAWSKGMFSGKGIGLYAIPNVGDGVWVSFENGDARYPIWEYGWFADDEVPEAARVNGDKPHNIVLQSTLKSRIELDDHNELIRITDLHGNIIELNENGVSIVTDNISLGTLNESDEPAVKGDTAHDLLVEFMSDLGNLKTIVTSGGTTAAVNTAANWAAFNTKWSTKWEEFKSDVVTLD